MSSPGVEVLRGGKVVAQTHPARYRRGARTIRLPLRHRLDGGSGTLRLTLSDPAGNTRVLKRTLNPPS